MINRSALSFLCIELDRNEMLEVTLVIYYSYAYQYPHNYSIETKVTFISNGEISWGHNCSRANGVAVWLAVCPCGIRLLERMMSPSPKSQVMFTSAFS